MSQKEWQHSAVALDSTGVVSWRDIADLLKMPKSTISDYLRKYHIIKDMGDEGLFDKEPQAPAPQLHDNSRILFISDMHIPYHHPGTLPFLEGLKRRYEPTRIICLGDELDHQALSFHDSDPDLASAGDELRKALPIIKQLEQMFPVMDLVDSNHGSLLYRKGKANGIPRHYLKGYNEVLQVGSGWKWHHDMKIVLPDGQKVYVHHGKSPDALKVAQAMGMNFVQGHHHEKFAVQYYSTPGNLLWGINSGCLIDRKSIAFAYNNNNLKRPVIGTSLIIDGYPVLEAMPL